MSYRRVLLVRWSRRDRLAVVVVASITALLVGSTLVLAAVGTTTAGVAGAADLESEGVATVVAGDDVDSVPPDSLRLPLAHARIDGEAATVVGVPADGPEDGPIAVPGPPESGVVRGPASSDDPVAIEGTSGGATVAVTDRDARDSLPSWWYVGTEGTVSDVGQTATLVVTPEDSGAVATDGGRSVPLVGALEYFLRGTDQLLDGVGVIAAGVGVLVAVVVFSVTRVAIRDRLETLAVLRATGATGRRVLVLFGARATLLTTLGVVAGAAAGVVLTNAAVNVAVFAGVPTTVSVRLTPRIVGVLAPALCALVVTGLVAGVAATLPTVRRSPAALHRRGAGPSTGSRAVDGGADARWTGTSALPSPGAWTNALGSRFQPDLLGSRAVLGTAGTLTVFVAAVLVATTAAGTLAPLAGDDGAAIVQGGAAHPWSSSVDADYATALRSADVTASPEILAFSVVDDEPFLTRGAEYDHFASLSDATVVAGDPPAGPGEAVVGRDLARTLGVDVGDRLPLGGANRPAVAEVEVAGIYRAPGFGDHQLVVPLATARHLTNAGPGEVNVIRVDEPLGDDGRTGEDGPTESATNETSVREISAPDAVGRDEGVPVAVTVQNRGTRRVTEDVRVELGGETRTESVALDPGERATVEVTFGPQTPGEVTARAGDRSVAVAVRAGGVLRFEPLPATAPPGAELAVRVVNATGDTVSKASVGLEGGETSRTGPDGRAAVTVPETGTTTIVASAPDHERTTHGIAVEAGAVPVPVGSLSVSPLRPDVLQRPTATLELRNPWNETRTWSVEVDGPGGSEVTEVALSPGERTTVETDLSRAGTGTHDVVAAANGTTVGRTEYAVEGDDRVASALATGDRLDAADSGLGQAAAHALGNLRVLLGTLVGLAAVATVAATAASFGRTVHVSRRTIAIHRATGATPAQTLARVLADAVRVAVPATLLAVLAGFLAVRLLAEVGLLTAFGVALLPSPSLATLAAVAVGALALALVAATIAAIGMVRVAPARLYAPTSGRPVGGRGGDPARGRGSDDDRTDSEDAGEEP